MGSILSRCAQHPASHTHTHTHGGACGIAGHLHVCVYACVCVRAAVTNGEREEARGERAFAIYN